MFGVSELDHSDTDSAIHVTVEAVDDHRFDIYYTPQTGYEKVASVDAAPNGFSYLRQLHSIDGFNQADYELLLEQAENDLAGQFDESPEDYNLAGSVAPLFENTTAGNTYKSREENGR